jgi:hypothetical protein
LKGEREWFASPIRAATGGQGPKVVIEAQVRRLSVRSFVLSLDYLLIVIVGPVVNDALNTRTHTSVLLDFVARPTRAEKRLRRPREKKAPFDGSVARNCVYTPSSASRFD